jgi:probable O-glycosylation ligase (exosortase A-associated)
LEAKQFASRLFLGRDKFNMRGLLFFVVYVSSLPLIFVSPFYGVLIWYVFSLGNYHTLIWGGPFSDLNYAYPIAIFTCISWLFSRTDKKQIPLTPLAVCTLLFMFWMTVSSFFALAPSVMVWSKWIETEKILFMCLVGYALTTTRDRVNQLIWAIVLALGVWGVKGSILSLLHGGGMIHGPDAGRNADNNHFAVALIIIIPLILYRWQLAANRHLRRGLMVMAFLVTLATILTYSRGALLGLAAAGAVFWLRSRAKLASGILILAVGVSVYALLPENWFDRMATIENYEEDGSATSRIDFWKASLRIAANNPLLGGGFNVTLWPNAVNPLLIGTDIPRYHSGKATHSSYFEVLSEHGWVGLGLFLGAAFCAWFDCWWLIRHSRNRPDLAWANLLGRMGQATLVGYFVSGAFQSLAYLDEYWCVLFLFDAARLVVRRHIASPAGASAMLLRKTSPGVGIPGLAGPDLGAGLANARGMIRGDPAR